MGKENPCTNKYKFLTYSFTVNNKDSNCIGFNLVEGDESCGVRSIAIFPNSKYVFIVDGNHNNLKRIDISTGQMKSGRKINEYFKNEYISLNDIAVFDGKIYLTSSSDIIIFDINLEYLSRIKMDTHAVNSVTFCRVTNDSLFVYLTHKQLKDRSIEENQLVITKNSFFMKSINIPITQFIEESKKKVTLGKEFRIDSFNGKNVLYNKFGCYELKNSIPIIKYYSSRNIDFEEKCIVFFDATPTQFILYCYLILPPR